jgi:hypothetical protein
VGLLMEDRVNSRGLLGVRPSRGRRLAGGVLLAFCALMAGGMAAGEAGARARHCALEQMHGTIHVASVTIRPCRGYAVAKSLTIMATGSVTIDKPIEVSSGASLKIIARGPIVNNAPIEPLPAGHAAARAADAPACPSPEIYEKSEVFGLTINAPVTAPSGETGAYGYGCRGTTIVLSAFVSKIVINAPVHAGKGGPGRANVSIERGIPGPCRAPAISGDETVVKGGNGGPGGDVDLDTQNRFSGGAVLGQHFIYAGDGGTGGGAGAGVPIQAPTGGANHSGGDIVAYPGNGGDGGNAQWGRRLVGHTGAGGSPGNVYVDAGNGGPPNCNGGNIEVDIPKGGQPGSLSLPALTPESDVWVGGADGYPGIPPNGDGGNGGSVTIQGGVPVASQSKTGKAAFVGRLKIIDAADGGPGANRCPAPGDKGGNGGNGGNLVLPTGLHTIYIGAPAQSTITNSFNAGPGGSGNPGGASGAGGTGVVRFDVVHDSFQPSDRGGTCPRTAYGSLNNVTGGQLAFTTQTSQPADAIRFTPADVDANLLHVEVSSAGDFPAGNCHVDPDPSGQCTGGAVPANTPVTGTIDFDGTIPANCGCIQVEFSSDNGQTWSPGTTLSGPPASSSTPLYQCVGAQMDITNSNGDQVFNGGTQPTLSTSGQTYCLLSVNTYHWNFGNGQTPGTIALSGADGELGPFTATGTPGQATQQYPEGVPNANWTATPASSSQPVIINGTYTCEDSDPATWSQNVASRGEGFCTLIVQDAQPG